MAQGGHHLKDPVKPALDVTAGQKGPMWFPRWRKGAGQAPSLPGRAAPFRSIRVGRLCVVEDLWFVTVAAAAAVSGAPVFLTVHI